MNQAELGRRLREARELCGSSQQEAAVAIGAPRTAITQIEAGNRAVSTLELTRLAKLYRVNVTHFFFEDEEVEDISVILHRSESGLDGDPAIRQKIKHCLDLCRKGREIEKLLMGETERMPPFYNLATPRNTGEAVAQAEQVAAQERRRLGIETMPITDMAELLATQGIWVAGTCLPDKVSGLFWHHRSLGLAILVNADHVRARRRFSYAHEYAHALMDRFGQTMNVSSTDNASDNIEKRANSFAAAFLMPKAGISEFLQAMDKGQPSKREQSIFDVANNGRIDTQWRSAPGSQTITYKDAATLAHHFGVSYQAAVYRLSSLDFLSRNECTELLKQEEVGRRYLHLLGMDKDLDGSDDDLNVQKRELKGQLISLAIEAYRREMWSRGQLLDLGDDLDLKEEEKETLLDLASQAKTS